MRIDTERGPSRSIKFRYTEAIPFQPTADVQRPLLPKVAGELASDGFTLKLAGLEAATQLGVELIRADPTNTELARRIYDLLDEKIAHVEAFRTRLQVANPASSGLNASSGLAAAVRRHSKHRRCMLPLAAWIVVCSTFEVSVLRAITADQAIANSDIGDIFTVLLEDELGHHDFACHTLAPMAYERSTWIERVRATVLLVELSAIAIFRWWPQRVPKLTTLGIVLDGAIDEFLAGTTTALSPLGIRFPERLFRWLLAHRLGLDSAPGATEVPATPSARMNSKRTN